MKKTLLFSNIVGNIFENNSQTIKFNEYMNEYLKANIDNSYSLIFINAPGLGNEGNYLVNIVKCFKNISVSFKDVLDIEENTIKDEINNFFRENKRIVIFLMGGNPITQMQIIDNLKLRDIIKNHNDLVIGFCAGAINLSKYSIITTDEDFLKSCSYNGIERVQITVEPHYNLTDDEKRNKEISMFAKKYNSKIFAIPDESMIVAEGNNIKEYGKVYYFE